jgi:nicotinamide-nucleotide amidase
MTLQRTEVVGCLLTIGDELLLGDIPNGNAHYIALQLRSRGFRLDRMITVGDREEEIINILEQCIRGSHFLIVTGGLGPTDDDRTNTAVSKAFDLPLLVNLEYSNWLRKNLERLGLGWSPELARLAEIPRGAVKLGRETAGFSLEHCSVPCYFLPGVPHEMRILLAETVIPDLENRFPNRSVYLKHVLRVQGLYESEVNRLLKDMSCESAGVQIGYLPQIRENWVTLFAAAESEEKALSMIREAEEQVISRVGAQHISGHNEECLEMVVGLHLKKKGWKLAAAESCTGGLFSRKITSVAGASDYFDRGFVTYSNQAKVQLLGVPDELLRAHGAVSEFVACAMAEGVRARASVNASIAITGIAGPTGGSPGKPVGTVFIACSTPSETVVEKHLFSGGREHVQECAAQAALVLLWKVLANDSNLHCP